jgi:enoyl-CoA hydratase/carnithine racemase
MGRVPALTTDGPVWTLDLGDDENRFSPTWLEEAEGLVARVTASTEPVALVTIGSGKFYSNGLDLEWVMAHPGDFFTYAARVQDLLATILTLPVPTIAALNGHAFGAGAMLALAHDFRIMRTDRGYFCLPEADIRIPFTEGMSALIQGKLAPQAAVASMTTGHRFGGEEAAAYGIVDGVAPLESLAAAAADRVRALAGKDRLTLGTIKSRMYAGVVTALRTPPAA